MTDLADPILSAGWTASLGPLFERIAPVLRAQKMPVYLVGGSVRDVLLRRAPDPSTRPPDLDFATPGDGLVLARAVAQALNAAFYPLDAGRGTGRVVLRPDGEPATYLDFATFRGRSLVEDLAGRDFTINAIALDLSADPPVLHDPLRGRADLEARVIRATSAQALADDPIRTLRAVRQAAELDFALDAATENLVQAHVTGLERVSRERVRDELLKLLTTPRPAAGVADLQRLGVLPYVLPEVSALEGVTQGPPHHLPVFEHTLAALQAWSDESLAVLFRFVPELRAPLQAYLETRVDGGVSFRTLIALAALLHDCGKPATRTVDEAGRIRFLGHEGAGATLAGRRLRRLHFSGEAVSFVATIVAHHLRPLHLAREGTASRRAVYRYYRDTKRAGVAVALLALADHRATYAPGQGREAGAALTAVVTALCRAYFFEWKTVKPEPLVSGRELMATFGLDEGPLIGRLLDALVEAQAVGEVQDRAQAMVYVAQKIQAGAEFTDRS